MGPLQSALLALCLAVAACGRDAPESRAGEEVPVRLALNWFPEAEHGGYYAALVHGLYERAGIRMEILGGGPDAPVVQRVATGEVLFGVTGADNLLNARAAGADIVAVMAPYQINPRCIMVHASTGLARIEDLADLTLALSQGPAFSHYLRWRYPFPGVAVVPYHGSIAPFLLDERYAQQGYVFSEPVMARRQGADVRVLMVAETGFNPYASLLIARRQTLSRQPDLVRAVTAAAVAGWQQYLDAPEETNQHIHQLNPEMDLEILAIGARESRPLVFDAVAAERGLGSMTAARWDTLQHQMEQAGVLEVGSAPAAQAFDDAFVPGRE